MSELWKKSLTHQFTWKLNCLNSTNSAWPLLVFKEWTTVKTPAGVSHILTSENSEFSWNSSWIFELVFEGWMQVKCHLMSVHQKQLPRKTSKQFNSKTVRVCRCDTTWCVSFPLLSVIHKFKMLDTHVKQCPKFCITRWVYASQIFRVQTDLKSPFCTVFFYSWVWVMSKSSDFVNEQPCCLNLLFVRGSQSKESCLRACTKAQCTNLAQEPKDTKTALIWRWQIIFQVLMC